MQLAHKSVQVSAYPRNQDSVGVSTSGIAHCTMKGVVEVLAC